jgi:hypothetical protein
MTKLGRAAPSTQEHKPFTLRKIAQLAFLLEDQFDISFNLTLR